MSRRNPWAFKIDYAAAIASDEAQIAHLADGGPADRAHRAAVLLAPEHASLPEGQRRPLANGLDVLWVALLRPAKKLGECLALLGVDRKAALAVVAYAAVRAPEFSWPDPGLAVEALLQWGDETCDCEALNDETSGRLLDVKLLDDDARRRELRRVHASLARHRRNAAARKSP